MSVLVKICGLTNLNDTLDAIECGADFLGFNFWPDSKRYISPQKAKEIISEIPTNIQKVGIFVNADYQEVIDLSIDLQLDWVQFHGDETSDFCNQFARPWFKAFRLKDESTLKQIPQYNSSWLLVDSYVEKAFGGTGVIANWHLARDAKKYGQLFLSGGLKPENIAMAIQSVKPYAVDVASGVESEPGKKDYHKMKEFIAKAKSV